MYKKINILLLSLFLLFAIIPFVSAVPPFVSSSSTGGCVVVPMMRESIKLNQAFDFNFHIINSTNGFPLSNTSVSCYFHLYNQTGDHSFAIRLQNDPITEHLVTNEFVARLGGTNFSTIGDYAYIVQCNGTVSTGGCAEKGLFTVTHSGFTASTSRAIFDIGLLFILVIFLSICMLLFIKFDNLLARVGMIGLSYLFLIAISFISWQMANDFLLSASFLVEMFRILFFVLIIGALPLLLGAFIWYFMMLMKIKEIENLMKHGMSEDEARHRQGRTFKRGGYR